jgi:hypothetical protein
LKSRNPHGPGAAAAGAEASARNCDAASCGKAMGAGLGWFERSAGAAVEADVD